jgi:hypothetical protein
MPQCPNCNSTNYNETIAPIEIGNLHLGQMVPEFVTSYYPCNRRSLKFFHNEPIMSIRLYPT